MAMLTRPTSTKTMMLATMAIVAPDDIEIGDVSQAYGMFSFF